MPASRTAALWFMLLGPLLTAFLQQQAMYVLTDAACRMQTRLLLHMPLLPALGLVALAFAFARREWRRGGEEATTDVEGVRGAARLFSLLGFASCGLALVLILAQWIPTLVLDPCQR